MSTEMDIDVQDLLDSPTNSQDTLTRQIDRLNVSPTNIEKLLNDLYADLPKNKKTIWRKRIDDFLNIQVEQDFDISILQNNKGKVDESEKVKKLFEKLEKTRILSKIFSTLI